MAEPQLTDSPDWTDGYFTDAPYPQRYYRELNPNALRFSVAGNAFAAPELSRPFTYMELGLGRGLSLAVNAAANPQGRFYGIDFMPEHVADVAGLGHAAKLNNLDVRPLSFGDLASQDYPDFDFVTLHGVWSWISAENRAHIRAFLNRKLKSSGIVYVSYNAMPGWLAMLPLRELMKAEFDRTSGTVEQRVAAAMSYAEAMRDAKAHFFEANAKAASRLNGIKAKPPAYLAHEYFNADWHAFYFSDVARDFAPLGLSFCGSAHVASNMDVLQVPANARAMVGRARNTVERETLKDFFVSRQFRRDVFVRASRPLDRTEFARQFGALSVARLVTSARYETLSLTAPAGKFAALTPHHRAIIAALGDGPMTVDQLAQRPDVASTFVPGGDTADSAVYLLVAMGAVDIAADPPQRQAAIETCRSLNRVLQADLKLEHHVLASPVLGGAVAVAEVDFTHIAAKAQGGREKLYDILASRGRHLYKDNAPVPENIARAKLAAKYDEFAAGALPVYEALGIVD